MTLPAVVPPSRPLALAESDWPASASALRSVAPRAVKSAPLWAVVLAGGWGVRLRPLTRLICGDDRPKQYVPLLGARSLLEQTLARAARRVAPERTVVVSLEAHASHLAAALSGHDVNLLLQSVERGTASGVLLPVHWIRERAPDATVVVFPSDHLVLEEEAFMTQVVDAAAFVEQDPGRIVLLGAEATEAETEYGWIEPGETLGHAGRTAVRAVRRFVEKPSREVAQACLAAGAAWNTFVFVAKARTLAEAGRLGVPRIHAVLERMVRAAARRDASCDTVRRLAAALPEGNFSRDVLQCVAPMLAVALLSGVTWCDWGSPRRVLASLDRLGVAPPWLAQLTEPGLAGSER